MNQIEEFNPPELRHTLSEAWRVVSQRRAWFGVAFCVLASLAFLASHWIPRKYTGSTLFERRNDLVLQSVIGASWDQTFEAQRRSLAFDLIGPSSLAEALDRTSAEKALPRGENGQLTPEGMAARDLLLARIAEETEVKMIESTPQRDIVEVRVVDGDSALASQLVAAIRESYAERSRAKLRALLQESLDYFNREAGLAMDQLRRDERRLSDLEKTAPGLTADMAGRATAETGALAAERTELRRRLIELRATEHATMQLAQQIAPVAAPSSAPVVLRDNPRRQELIADMTKLEQMINDEKVLRGKTDEHPTVVAMKDKWERLRADYRREPERIPATDQSIPTAAGQTPASPATMLATAQRQIQSAESRLAAVQQRLDELEAFRSTAAEKRPEHAALREVLDRRQTEMAAWRTRIDPISRILSAHGQERGVQFICFREPGSIAKPTSPDARVIMLACLAIGLFGGAATIVLLEFGDRSFRTAVQVSKSLALPVLETIEEIITPAVRRQRMVRKLVFAPAFSFVLFAALVVAGGSAYLSLESHDLYEQIKRDPLHPMRAVRESTARPTAARETVLNFLADAAPRERN